MGDDQSPFHNPFAAIAHLRGDLPESANVSAPSDPPPAPRRLARAVVRIERSGRGGKEVTVVEHLELPADQLGQWLKALKAALGCGGTVDASTIVLQGDQRKRLPALLSARGVKRVTVA